MEPVTVKSASGQSGSVAPYVSQCPVLVTAITRAVELDRPSPV